MSCNLQTIKRGLPEWWRLYGDNVMAPFVIFGGIFAFGASIRGIIFFVDALIDGNPYVWGTTISVLITAILVCIYHFFRSVCELGGK